MIMQDVIGALMDEGYSPQEVREMVGPMLAEMDDASESDLGSHVLDRVVEESGHEQAVQAILTRARDSRQPPGPQVVVPSGVINSLPQSTAAKPIRVDTEDSYRAFRRSGRDLPEDEVEALSARAQDELMGDFERGYASQWMVGNVMDHEVASVTALHDNPNVSLDQACVLCGVPGGVVVCANCGDRLPALLGLFDRGYASQHIVGLFERGAAASLHDDNPSTGVHGYLDGAGVHGYLDGAGVHGDDDFYRLQRMSDDESSVLGAGEFYRLPVQDAEGWSAGQSPLVGQDGFYRLPRHSLDAGGLSPIIGDVMALSVPSTVYAEEIPLSFHRPDQYRHIAAWKQGAHIYGSIRVTGWDGQPRILTAATPYVKEVGIVVGYSTSAAIPPTQTIAVIDPLARQLGASYLLPRLAAAAPAVLRVSHDKLAPIIMTAMPAGRSVQGSWI
jgi:hypothetical protein